MQDRPNLDELLAGIEGFLKEQVAPLLDNPLLFHTLVAANLLVITRRELAQAPEALERELAGLRSLMPEEASRVDGEPTEQVTALNHELCRLIQQGRANQGPLRRKLMKHLAATLDDNLKISNPAMVDVAGKLY